MGSSTTTRIRLAAPEDAGLIAAAVHRCYGSTYVHPAAADPDRLAAEIRAGDVAYALAFSADSDQHLGQVALFRVGGAAWEVGRAVVHPEHRSAGICNLLSDALIHDYAPARGLRLVTGHIVTTHTFVQQYALSRGFVLTGMLLGMVPETLSPAGIPPCSQPGSILMGIKPLAPSSRRRGVRLAGADGARVLALLRQLRIPARQVPSGNRFASLAGRCVVHEHLGVRHISYSPEGEDGPDPLLESVGTDQRATWADVPFEHPEAGALVERLREQGFGWGAVIPGLGRNGEDVLRLQRLENDLRLDREAIKVLDPYRGLRDEVFSDVTTRQGVCA